MKCSLSQPPFLQMSKILAFGLHLEITRGKVSAALKYSQILSTQLPHGPRISKKIKTNFQPSMKLLPIPQYLLNHFTRRKKLCRNREPIQNSKERLKTRTHKLTTFTSCEEIKLMVALFIWFSQINFKQKISPLTK